MSLKSWLVILSAVIAMSFTATAQPADTKAQAGEAAPAAQRRVPDTLMFTIDELTEIQSRVSTASEHDKGSESSNAIEGAALYLSTIVYYGPKNWTIWVNGKPISPDQDFQSFKVTDIGPRFVEFVVPLSAPGMRPVRLEPNQTFIAKSGAIVEGVWQP